MSASHDWIRRLRQRAADDHGTSLMELVVGMAVMAVFMGIFTSAMVSLARTTTKIEAVSSSASQVNNAFLRLDKLVRYANAVTTPGQGASTGDWYVELDTIVDATESCTQLRVDIATQQLQQRTWTVTGSSSYANLSAWLPLADKVLNAAAARGAADQPFSVPAAVAAASSSLQRISVTLVTGTSGPASTSTTRSSLTFTALNSNSSDAKNATQCQQLGPTVTRP